VYCLTNQLGDPVQARAGVGGGLVLAADPAVVADAVQVPEQEGRRLDALEKRLGVRLMHRSTRGLTLTALGEQFIEPCRQLLRDFDITENSISAGRSTVRGHLVVSAPAAFGRKHVAPHAPAFRAIHTELKMSFNFTDSVVDLVREGYDMAIRIGEATDPNYVAIPLFPNRRVVCGTPDYFERNGVPRTPEDLTPAVRRPREPAPRPAP